MSGVVRPGPDANGGTGGQGRSLAQESEIFDRIFEAVMEQRLPPGAKLSEVELCSAFGVGRMRVRRVLVMLAVRELVTLHSHRGAFVASPTPEEAKRVFEARRLIEPNLMRLTAERATEESLTDLELHIEKEKKARATQDRPSEIRLSGEFHVKLASLSGNPDLTRIVKELVMRTSLIIGLFSRAGGAGRHDHDHGDLIAALRDRAADRAAALMLVHLEHIEAELQVSAPFEGEVDLRRALAGKTPYRGA